MQCPIWKELTGIGAAVAFALIAFSVIDAPPMSREEVADWVQGIGTIAAVGVAAWVGLIPVRMDTARKAAGRSDFAQAIHIAAYSAVSRWDDALTAAESENLIELKACFRGLAGVDPIVALDRLLDEPITTWPSPTLYLDTLDLRDTLRAFVDTAKSILSARSDWHPGIWHDMRERADYVAEISEVVFDSVRDIHGLKEFRG